MKARFQSVWNGIHDTTMLLALVLWLCATPLILLLTVPFFGWETGLTALAITLIAAILICWRICLFPTDLSKENSNVKGSRMR